MGNCHLKFFKPAICYVAIRPLRMKSSDDSWSRPKPGVRRSSLSGLLYGRESRTHCASGNRDGFMGVRIKLYYPIYQLIDNLVSQPAEVLFDDLLEYSRARSGSRGLRASSRIELRTRHSGGKAHGARPDRTGDDASSRNAPHRDNAGRHCVLLEIVAGTLLCFFQYILAVCQAGDRGDSTHGWLCYHQGRINGGTRYAGQFALPGQRQKLGGADPLLANFYRLIPDFFLSQSNSIFKRPISEYSRSGVADGSAGFRPRLASNRLPACSCSSFFHKPTCVGCTPNSWPISFTVLMPRIASRATLALNSPLKFLRFVSLTTCSFL